MDNSMHPFGLGLVNTRASAANNKTPDIEALARHLQGLNLNNSEPQSQQAQAAPALWTQPISQAEATRLHIEQIHGMGIGIWDSPMLDQYLVQIIEQAMRRVQQHPESFRTHVPSQATQSDSAAREA
jgi:hypothetical protein